MINADTILIGSLMLTAFAITVGVRRGGLLSRAVLALSIFTAVYAQWLRIRSAEFTQTDLGNYAKEFTWVKSSDLFQYLDGRQYEFGFTFISWILGQVSSDERVWLFLVGLSGVLFVGIGLVRMLGVSVGLFGIAIYLSYSLYLAYLNVAIRQGVAFGVFLCGVSFLSNEFAATRLRWGKSEWIGGLLLASSILFHSSALLVYPILGYHLWIRRRLFDRYKLQAAFVIFTLFMVIGAMIYSVGLAGLYSRFLGYGTEAALVQYGRFGPRWDFAAVLTTAFVFLALPLRVWREPEYRNVLIALGYLILVYLPTIGIAFNDRIAAYALLFVPVVALKRMHMEPDGRFGMFAFFLVGVSAASNFASRFI